MKLGLAILVLGFATQAFADPTEVVLASKILGVKDAKTGQNYILKGNKARVYAKVSVHAKGYANRGLRQWLEKRLPAAVEGYFEREDKDTGLSVRYKPVPFRIKKREIFCTAGTTPEFEICHADFAVSSANAVDIPGGEGGEHTVALQMLAPQNDLHVKMAKANPAPYHVLQGDPKLSRFGFAGMPDH